MLNNKERKELKTIEKEIEKLETEKEKLDAEYTDISNTPANYEDIGKQMKTVTTRLDAAMLRWEELAELD